MKFLDLKGQIFGRLTALERAENRGKHTQWLCRCDCGAEKVVGADHLRSGHTISCGCVWHEVCVKHGHGHDANGKQTRTYKAWVNMRSRADGVTAAAKAHYQDRGITVCARWAGSFEMFLADMHECPPGLTLDRIDNDGNYEPGNCRWATVAVQNSNTRRTIKVELDGDTMSLAEASRRVGLNYQTVISRVHAGKTPMQALGVI